jgi:hypothetical protein
MIKPGTYRARAIEAALSIAGTGNEQAAVAVELLDGESAGESVTWFGYFTDKTRESTLRTLRVFWWGGDLTDLGSIGQCGAEVEVVVEREADADGTLRDRVRWINPIGGGLRLKNRMTREQVVEFAKRLAGSAAAGPAVAGDARAPSASPTNSGAADPGKSGGRLPF